MNPIPDELSSARFHLWIPETVEPGEKIRGLIAISGYYGFFMFSDNFWKVLAEELRMGIFFHDEREYYLGYTHVGRPDTNKVSINAIIESLNQFSKISGHPELKYTPMIFAGISASGMQALGLAASLPERAIGVIANCPAKFGDQLSVLPPNFPAEVPAFIYMAENERFNSAMPKTLHETVLLPAREKDAPWVGVFMGGGAHADIGEPSLVMQWAREICRLRLPDVIPANAPIHLRTIDVSKGWLGKIEFDLEKTPTRPKKIELYPYEGQLSSTAYWLPNESIAKTWKAYCLTTNVVYRQMNRRSLDITSFKNSLGMEMIKIPEGQFLMGSPRDEVGRDEDEIQHKVILTRPFYIGSKEVTQEQWGKLMENNSSLNKGSTFPIDMISYEEAELFCEKLSEMEGKTYRLPTEAEWEYACRAGSESPFYFGHNISTSQANFRGDVGYNGAISGIYRDMPVPVGSFPANDWGLYDMHGNVLEWCSDWYGPYSTDTVTDPEGAQTGPHRVIRGGSWFNGPEALRSAFRSFYERPNNQIGFRVVCEIP